MLRVERKRKKVIYKQISLRIMKVSLSSTNEIIEHAVNNALHLYYRSRVHYHMNTIQNQWFKLHYTIYPEVSSWLSLKVKHRDRALSGAFSWTPEVCFLFVGSLKTPMSRNTARSFFSIHCVIQRNWYICWIDGLESIICFYEYNSVRNIVKET